MLWQKASAMTVASSSSVVDAAPLEDLQRSHGARTLAPLAERDEVVLADEFGRRGIHRVNVERTPVPHHVVTAESGRRPPGRRRCGRRSGATSR